MKNVERYVERCLPRWTSECIEIFTFSKLMEMSSPLLMQRWCHTSRLLWWKLADNWKYCIERTRSLAFVCILSGNDIAVDRNIEVEFQYDTKTQHMIMLWGTHIKMNINLSGNNSQNLHHITDLSDFECSFCLPTANRWMYLMERKFQDWSCKGSSIEVFSRNSEIVYQQCWSSM